MPLLPAEISQSCHHRQSPSVHQWPSAANPTITRIIGNPAGPSQHRCRPPTAPPPNSSAIGHCSSPPTPAAFSPSNTTLNTSTTSRNVFTSQSQRCRSNHPGHRQHRCQRPCSQPRHPPFGPAPSIPLCPGIVPTSALVLPPALPVGSVPPTRDLCLPCPQHEPSILHCRHTRPITCVSVFSLPPKQASPMATVLASLGCQKSPRECRQLRKCAVQSFPFTWVPSLPPGHTLLQTVTWSSCWLAAVGLTDDSTRFSPSLPGGPLEMSSPRRGLSSVEEKGSQALGMVFQLLSQVPPCVVLKRTPPTSCTFP